MDSAALASFSEPSVFLKAIEFILTIISISVEQGGLASFSKQSGDFFFGGAMIMTITVSGLLLICYMLGQQRHIQNTHFEFSFDCIGALFQLTAGALAISEYAGKSGNEAAHANAAGSVCIVTSAVYIFDAYYAYINYRSIMTQPPPSQQNTQSLPPSI
ncbi:uncharacterized protein LOC108676525 isoform X1 [Hyalella azteca]|uniref:Uncharacterized protein LOC108676525 isoform X1 n=1 Tax=Hyalella azteca TaxID=294128 RepID=A0A979FLK4_HYAAZ|nr:uncharacterized protein LOC108676525 isoform X1 [Hyalella azteca]